MIGAGAIAISDVRDVVAGGRRLVRDGTPAVGEAFLADSDRVIHLTGQG